MISKSSFALHTFASGIFDRCRTRAKRRTRSGRFYGNSACLDLRLLRNDNLKDAVGAPGRNFLRVGRIRQIEAPIEFAADAFHTPHSLRFLRGFVVPFT